MTTAESSRPTAEPWQPFREPLRDTLTRTIIIALVAGAIVAPRWGGFARWPFATLLMLWPSLGGHFVDLWFLNWLRPRLSPARSVHVAARLAVWFVAGCVLGVAMLVTARILGRSPAIRLPVWWVRGVGFVGLELIAHAGIRLRGRPSFFDARG